MSDDALRIDPTGRDPLKEPDVYIQVVFTDQQKSSIELALKHYGMVMADYADVSLSDMFHYPYQIQLHFHRLDFKGDRDYSDWRDGDTFVYDEDPYGEDYTGFVDQEHRTVIVREDGEDYTAPFEQLRRVGKRVD